MDMFLYRDVISKKTKIREGFFLKLNLVNHFVHGMLKSYYEYPT